MTSPVTDNLTFAAWAVDNARTWLLHRMNPTLSDRERDQIEKLEDDLQHLLNIDKGHRE